jgi:hypothetical protein
MFAPYVSIYQLNIFMKHFMIDNLIYDTKKLKASVQDIDNWQYYGTGRARLGITRWSDSDTKYVASKFKNARKIISAIQPNLIHPYERVLPHTDHNRRITCNIPVSGDFKNSYVKFYKKDVEGTINSYIPDVVSDGNTSMNYHNATPIGKISYTTPICFDTQEVHGVDNLTSQPRYIITVSFNLDLSYEDILDMYNAGELLQ